MQKIYITWKMTRKKHHLLWHCYMKKSAPYDWMKDDGGIPWKLSYYHFIGFTMNEVTKKVNKQIDKISKYSEYPIEIVFPSTQGQNIDWA